MSTLPLRATMAIVACTAVLAAQGDPAAPGVAVTLACNRQAVAAAESFPVKITISNESRAPSVAFDRSDVLSAESMVAASFDRKGQWVSIDGPPAPGAIELRPGESFTIGARVKLPESLAKGGTALTLQWVGRGPLDAVRSNEVSVAIRQDRNPTATLETSEGTIVLELWPDKAPNHVANFLTLAKSGFYDGRLFHRVIAGFMIQTGCPLGTGMGDPGYKIAAEFTDTPFVKGTLGMARADDKDSAGSQFFVCVADARTLDNKYTAFGRVIEGQDVADKISQVPRDTQRGDRPYQDVLLKKVTVAIPESYTLLSVEKVGQPAPETRSGDR